MVTVNPNTVDTTANAVAANAAKANLSNVSQETNPSKASLDGKTLSSDFNTFLKLLTTQLKNQDPTQPLDTNQFTQQLVSFSEVEQAVTANKHLEELVAASGGGNLNAGVGYIGQVIEANGNSGVLSNGVAPFVYDLPSAASKASVVVTDETGQVVFSGNGSVNAGRNLVTWDGKNSKTGATMSDGVYHIAVTATDANGKAITPTTYTSGVVSAITKENGVLTLNVGSLKIPVTDVSGVRGVQTVS